MEPTKRVGIPHLTKMKPLEFIELCYYLRDKGYVVSQENMWITEKVDGFGIRFGCDANGEFFLESSNSGPQYESGAFSRYNIQKHGASTAISEGYDMIFDRLSDDDRLLSYLRSYRNGIKIIGECLYTPNAIEDITGGLQFLNAVYDKDKLGTWATFVCFGVMSPKPLDFVSVMDGLMKLSNERTKYAIPYIDYEPVNVKLYVDTVLEIAGKKEILSSRKVSDRPTKEALLEIITSAQEGMGYALLSKVRGTFGELEGLVFELPGGNKFKVVTDEFRERKRGSDSQRCAFSGRESL